MPGLPRLLVHFVSMIAVLTLLIGAFRSTLIHVLCRLCCGSLEDFLFCSGAAIFWLARNCIMHWLFMAANFFHCGRLHIALGGGDDEIFRANRFIVLCVYLDKDVAAKALSCLPWHLTTDGTLAGAPSTLIMSSHPLGSLEERPMQQNNSLWCAI